MYSVLNQRILDCLKHAQRHPDPYCGLSTTELHKKVSKGKSNPPNRKTVENHLKELKDLHVISSYDLASSTVWYLEPQEDLIDHLMAIENFISMSKEQQSEIIGGFLDIQWKESGYNQHEEDVSLKYIDDVWYHLKKARLEVSNAEAARFRAKLHSPVPDIVATLFDSWMDDMVDEWFTTNEEEDENTMPKR